jgi:hypothetical protein
MRRPVPIFVTVVCVLAFSLAAGCANPESKLKAAAGAENSGDYRQAAELFAALALESAPALRLPEAQKGKVMQPPLWQSEMDKYMKWLIEPAPQKTNVLRDALDGFNRCAPRFEQDNTAHTAPAKPLDSLPAFTQQWNLAFNPPPPGTIDWNAIVQQAEGKKFSVLRLSAGQSYTYEINVVSRKTWRRVGFTLYPESQLYVPLPPADYVIIVRSSVDFQQGQHWLSDFSAINLSVTGEPSLIAMDLRTKVTKKQ